jgi:hypothetical protein
MIDWTADELDRISAADELQITTTRPDGSVRPWVPIWAVQVDGALVVRSYWGTDGAWYRHATQLTRARARAGGVEHDVTVDRPDDPSGEAIDRAYRSKYARYAGSYLDPMVTDQARAATLRLTPAINTDREDRADD